MIKTQNAIIDRLASLSLSHTHIPFVEAESERCLGAIAMGKLLVMIGLCMVLLCIIGARAQTQHVVGADHGWDTNSDLASWSNGRRFHVGDKIWFTYSAAHENIVELKSKEEYEACDVSNPIMMLTDGLDVLTLEEDGSRYFVSGKSDSCKNGLKLHVDVQSQSKPNDQNTTTSKGTTLVVADGPTTPSASSRLSWTSFGFFVWFSISYFVVGCADQLTHNESVSLVL